LRLMRGQTDAACAAILGVTEEAKEIRPRANILAACVEISLAAGQANAARDAADQLMQLASEVNAPLLDAIASRANGDVLLASGDIARALTALRHAFSLFRELDAPFDEARVRVMLAEACQKQKDCDTAELELDVAGRIFEQLGAAWDRSRVDELV